MIYFYNRHEIDTNKYNACVDKSSQSNMYAYAWYLDIVADNWSVLVLNDYEAVMPLPWKQKYLIKYVYPPFWLLQLGIFSVQNTLDETIFLEVLFKKFRFIEHRMNVQNKFTNFLNYRIQKQLQVVSLGEGYANVYTNFRKDRKKDLRKAKLSCLSEKWNDDPQKLINLFKENVGERTKQITEKEYDNLLMLMQTCIEKNRGEILSVYDAESCLVGAAFFLKHTKRVTILVSSTDFKKRKNGVNTFLIDRAIFKYQNDFKVFDFGGSSMLSIASYFKSFGAMTQEYQQLKYNNLPFILRLFKR